MADAPEQPIPWRCLNCNERVDPTMALCWNCGHDREGVAQPALFVDAVHADTSRCAACSYDLQGNPDATSCPECGEPVPWEDCDVCGVRAGRALMADGCPCCRAEAAGLAFIPEVQRKQYPTCPDCQYDFRGRPGVTRCPECGAAIDRGRYETVVESDTHARLTIETIRRKRRYWMRVLLIMLPGSLVVIPFAVGLMDVGLVELGLALLVIWGVGLFACIIQLASILLPFQDRDAVGRRPR